MWECFIYVILVKIHQFGSIGNPVFLLIKLDVMLSSACPEPVEGSKHDIEFYVPIEPNW
jgi:hypothetical protein